MTVSTTTADTGIPARRDACPIAEHSAIYQLVLRPGATSCRIADRHSLPVALGLLALSGCSTPRCALVRGLWRLFSRMDAVWRGRHPGDDRPARRPAAERDLPERAISARCMQCRWRHRRESRLVHLVRPLAVQAAGTKHRSRRALAAALIVIAFAGICVVYVLHHGALHPATDDATIDADVVHVAAAVGGRIIAIPVAENSEIAKGALLFQIDSRSLPACGLSDSGGAGTGAGGPGHPAPRALHSAFRGSDCPRPRCAARRATSIWQRGAWSG